MFKLLMLPFKLLAAFIKLMLLPFKILFRIFGLGGRRGRRRRWRKRGLLWRIAGNKRVWAILAILGLHHLWEQRQASTT